jgi:hypothetical protein
MVTQVLLLRLVMQPHTLNLYANVSDIHLYSSPRRRLHLWCFMPSGYNVEFLIVYLPQLSIAKIPAEWVQCHNLCNEKSIKLFASMKSSALPSLVCLISECRKYCEIR